MEANLHFFLTFHLFRPSASPFCSQYVLLFLKSRSCILHLPIAFTCAISPLMTSQYIQYMLVLSSAPSSRQSECNFLIYVKFQSCISVFLNTMFLALMVRFQLKNFELTLFSVFTVVPFNCCVLSCRPFVVITSSAVDVSLVARF